MKQPDAARTLDLLAALSHATQLSVGCAPMNHIATAVSCASS
jgi:hypothetical protein